MNDERGNFRHEDNAALKAILADLETVRQHIKELILKRFFRAAAWSVPVFVLMSLMLSLMIWGNASIHHKSFEFSSLVAFMGIGAVIGAAIGVLLAWIAAQNVVKAYNKFFKERVMPKLLADFGGHLEWHPAQSALNEFKQHFHLYPHWDYVNASDGIEGEYRGIPLSIFDLDRTVKNGKTVRRVFGGIVIHLMLPHGLQGVTIVAPQGKLSSFGEQLFDGLQSVHLEDPAFAKTFQVRASHQVSARALLTPAFMERFLHLAASRGTPEMMAEGKRFFIALPTSAGTLFTPPNYRDPNAVRKAVTRFHQNIANYLYVVDAVIDLDQSARQQATETASQS